MLLLQDTSFKSMIMLKIVYSYKKIRQFMFLSYSCLSWCDPLMNILYIFSISYKFMYVCIKEIKYILQIKKDFALVIKFSSNLLKMYKFAKRIDPLCNLLINFLKDTTFFVHIIKRQIRLATWGKNTRFLQIGRYLY